MKNHKWIVFSETSAECEKCGCVRSKEYHGNYKLRKVYADSLDDLRVYNVRYKAGRCK